MARKQSKQRKRDEEDVKTPVSTVLFQYKDDRDILDDVNEIVKLKKVKSALPLMREIFGGALREFRAGLETKEAKQAS